MDKVIVAYLILAHNNEHGIKKLIDLILFDDPNGYVFIHFDKNGSDSIFNNLKKYYLLQERCVVLQKRIKCSWGEYSLVDATLKLLYEANIQNHFSHYYLLSASCFPIKPLKELKIFLRHSKKKSYIQCETSSWILAGMRDDRYKYYHIANFKKNPALFRFIYRAQKKLGIHKRMPPEIKEVRFGSQWWCMTNTLVKNIFDYLEHDKYFIPYFKTAWIPDECFFQTLAWHLNKKNIVSKTLTFYEFDPDGKPFAFCLKDINKKDKKLKNFFFLRKISANLRI